MKGNRDKLSSETMPETVVIKLSKSNFQIRYNFSEKPATKERVASFDYDYINVSDITKKVIKSAIIKTKYDYDDEIAAINNNNVDYQAFRNIADNIALEAVENYE